jgi:hypothetical protein
MRDKPFSRPTIVAASELLEICTQASFDAVVLRLSLEQAVAAGQSISVAKKCGLLARAVLSNSTITIQTLDGPQNLTEALIREAIAKCSQSLDSPLEIRLGRGLALDGFVPFWDIGEQKYTIIATLPSIVAVTGASDEVHSLIAELAFTTPSGHLMQAIDAHARGDWAAANSQIRTFFESFFDEVAFRLGIDPNRQLTSENRRAALGSLGFLSQQRNEWSVDGKNYVNGLFKMLHTEGSHPGLSDEEHCTFRLQTVLVTSRMFLRRLRLKH